MQYEIEEYTTPNGKSPFADWLADIRDGVAQAKLTARIDRAAHGNFGDWKALSGAGGVYEIREHYGSGYRIYYSVIGRKIVLLLAGSTKKDQNKVSAKAKEYLADYRRRTEK